MTDRENLFLSARAELAAEGDSARAVDRASDAHEFAHDAETEHGHQRKSEADEKHGVAGQEEDGEEDGEERPDDGDGADCRVPTAGAGAHALTPNDDLIPPTLFDGESASAELVERETLAYVDGVLAKSIPANRWVIAACRRFRKDLDRPDLRMDWERVAHFVTFCGRLELTLSHAGQAFVLLPWQLWVAAAVLGFVNVSDGTRRTQFAVLQIARKAGKSTFAAAIALYCYRDGQRGNRVHIIANTTEQSQLIVGTAEEMFRRTWPDEFEEQFRGYPRPHFKDDALDGRMTIVVAKDRTLDGLNPSLWIGDEASEWRGRFLTKLTTAQGARSDPLGIIVTTPGDNPDLIYTAEVLADAYAVLGGDIELDDSFYALYGFDEEDEPGDEAVWEKANPGLRYGQPKLDYLRRNWAKMRRSPIRRAEWCRFHGARFSATKQRWLDMEFWDDASRAVDLDALVGRKVWVGLDLSAKHDLTAGMLCFPWDDGTLLLSGRYWWPEERARDREQEYSLPLRRWVAERRITLCKGLTVDNGLVAEWLRWVAATFQVQGVAYDRWNASDLAHELITKDRLPMIPYDMRNDTFVPGCAHFERLWLERRIVHGGDPILRRACADSGAKEVSTGQYRLIKAHRFAVIDPLVSTIYATHLWSVTKNKTRETYENVSEITV